MTVAPLAAFLVGILVAWSYKRRIAQHRERLRDLQETRGRTRKNKAFDDFCHECAE